MSLFVKGCMILLLIVNLTLQAWGIEPIIDHIAGPIVAYLPLLIMTFTFAVLYLITLLKTSVIDVMHSKEAQSEDQNLLSEEMFISKLGIDDMDNRNTLFPEVDVVFRLCGEKPLLESISLSRTGGGILPDCIETTTAFCSLCGVPKFPGTSHCPECNKCIFYKDHHCAWLGCCVGARNYLSFLMFLISATLLLAISLGNCVVGLVFLSSCDIVNKKSVYIATLVIIVLALPIFGFTLQILIHNLILVFKRKTARESIKPINTVRCVGNAELLRETVYNITKRRSIATKRISAFNSVPSMSCGRYASIVEGAFMWSLLLCGWCDDVAA